MSELVKALIAAQKQVRGSVFKAGKNQHARYRYTGHEHVNAHCRDALVDNGLTLSPKQASPPAPYVMTTRSGETQCMLWHFVYTLEHVSGESRDYEFHASTQCNDKAGYVASTAADRTALLRVMRLNGSDEEDPEHDSHDDAQPPPSKSNGTAPKLSAAQQAAKAIEEAANAGDFGELEQLSRRIADSSRLQPKEKNALSKAIKAAHAVMAGAQ